MSSFRRMFKSLRAEVRASKNAARFQAARPRHEVFDSHDSIASVLGALATMGQKTYAEKEALTRALLAEHQSSSSSFWSTVLLVAYYPMLSRLRRRIYGDLLPDEDLDQLVVTSFLAVITDFPLAAGLDRSALRLRQGTERRVFRVLRGEHTQRKLFHPVKPPSFEKLEPGQWPDLGGETSEEPPSPAETAGVVSLLVEYAGDLLDGETFDLVTATLVCGRRIRAVTGQWHPDLSPDEHHRAYQRIKRQHSRVLARIRPAFEHLRCPREDGDCLCHTVSSEQQEVFER